ncbi:HNH endonuclease signature motif containing protein [Pseudomonas huanghezhanensis]|uniref:HNH endonuclease signature motif containing protein n=1 Tax=Pseudomonas huanghezhanensis TaxID=3002903 RepID=UPI002286454A|nr:HNH endonuclease signature motif containing protein [Pseudomonas sp. BSw22131]
MSEQTMGLIAQQALERARQCVGNNPSARRFWTNREIECLTELYPDQQAAAIAQQLNRPISAIHSKAKALGLKKSEAFLNGPLSGRLDGVRGTSTRFQKGVHSWSKGMSRPATGRSAETQFAQGGLPHNHVPIGTEVLATDGYLKIKVAEPNKWEWTHRRNWEVAHGPIPKGMVLVFKTPDRTNCDIDNLELLTRSELMRRNSIQRYPQDVKDAIRLLGKLKRTIEASHE